VGKRMSVPSESLREDSDVSKNVIDVKLVYAHEIVRVPSEETLTEQF